MAQNIKNKRKLTVYSFFDCNQLQPSKPVQRFSELCTSFYRRCKYEIQQIQNISLTNSCPIIWWQAESINNICPTLAGSSFPFILTEHRTHSQWKNAILFSQFHDKILYFTILRPQRYTFLNFKL